MKSLDLMLAEELLRISAVKLQPGSPFVWSSGWRSPIYMDNRLALSYPRVRNFIKVELARLIVEHFPQVEVVAGVATGAIAEGALAADLLSLPFIYLRAVPKDHGLENLIEGNLKPGQKVVVVEDLVSTGQSSLKAVDNVRLAGGEVVGMVAVFDYQFPVAREAFDEAGVKLVSISGYDALIKSALALGQIKRPDVEVLRRWREDPQHWDEPGPAPLE